MSIFAVHILNEEGISKARAIQSLYEDFLASLEKLCIEGREFSLAKTKLEESSFFAKKSMATNLNNQKVN